MYGSHGNNEGDGLDDIQGHWFSSITDDKPQFFRKILPDVSNLSNVHSIQLSLQWRDQGWGNRKGKLFIVRSIETSTTMASEPSRAHKKQNISSLRKNDKIMYESPTAEHTVSKLTASVTLLTSNESNQNYKYSIWLFVGGGGGHSLRINNLSIKYLTYSSIDL